jgi:hypothetical protein
MSCPSLGISTHPGPESLCLSRPTCCHFSLQTRRTGFNSRNNNRGSLTNRETKETFQVLQKVGYRTRHCAWRCQNLCSVAKSTYAYEHEVRCSMYNNYLWSRRSCTDQLANDTPGPKPRSFLHPLWCINALDLGYQPLCRHVEDSKKISAQVDAIRTEVTACSRNGINTLMINAFVTVSHSLSRIVPDKNNLQDLSGSCLFVQFSFNVTWRRTHIGAARHPQTSLSAYTYIWVEDLT